MKKRIFSYIISFALILGMLCGCGAKNRTEDSKGPDSGGPTSSGEPGGSANSVLFARPCLIYADNTEIPLKITPSVAHYTVQSNLKNVENLEQFYFDEQMERLLVQNGFVVCGTAGHEFFEIYEQNRYSQKPNFVTVDSLMHTYHLYFSLLLKNMERDYLAERLTQLSRRMLAESTLEYEQLSGSEWEEAARRNVAFFGVAARLLGETVEVDAPTADIIDWELNQIRRADTIATSRITGAYEDYTQYIPRGYYEGDPKLERYFKAMMWYGRIQFSQENNDLNRSALLMTKALENDAEAYSLWESIYAVTAFFAGASDDLGVCEYKPAITKAYGADIRIEELIGDETAFQEFCGLIAKLPAPQINSIPIEDGESNVIMGFRFMGQRFTIDAAIMQKLIYSSVDANSSGEKRMLPDVLDVPAALGSDTALDILKSSGAADFSGYTENMAKLRDGLAQEDSSIWSASLYAGWLNTLRPLLETKGDGYPAFMQSREWSKKNLECFAGSFTELKHDTILYAKQVIAEMGGDQDENMDDRGYVEPEPLVYTRFSKLALATAEGLKRYGMLSSDSEEDLNRLSQIAEHLLLISKKELQNEELTAEEYDFIRSYGGNIEHFWYEAVQEESSNESIYTEDFPASLVVDIATDPNGGRVLEAATGNPSMIYVVVPVAGKLRIATGSVYTFYQFEWPSNDRLTDSKWRLMMGLQCDEEGNYNYDTAIRQPDWTASYRWE